MVRKVGTPPLTDEAAETKLIELAMRRAQEQLENGTASAQVITHFLRLGSNRARVEVAKLELESRFLEERIASEQAGQKLQEMFEDVLHALKSYSYSPPSDHENLY